MSVLGGDGGRRQAGWPGADYRHPFCLRRFAIDQFGFMGGARIDQATGALVGESMIQASLVAGDAGIDFVDPAGRHLLDEIRVGQERPRHRHQVGVSAGQDVFGFIGHVDAVRRHHGNRQFAAQAPRQTAKRRARHRGDDSRHARFMPTDAGIDDGGARLLQRLGDRDHVVPAVAAVD